MSIVDAANACAELLKGVHEIETIVTNYEEEVHRIASKRMRNNIHLATLERMFYTRLCYYDVLDSLKRSIVLLESESREQNGIGLAHLAFEFEWEAYEKLLIDKYMMCLHYYTNDYVVGSDIQIFKDPLQFYKPIEEFQRKFYILSNFIGDVTFQQAVNAFLALNANEQQNSVNIVPCATKEVVSPSPKKKRALSTKKRLSKKAKHL